MIALAVAPDSLVENNKFLRPAKLLEIMMRPSVKKAMMPSHNFAAYSITMSEFVFANRWVFPI
ncbi:hypothetical protein [Weissella confusa]|uniref:hypothetical protein n=1 Tax=Weissella confusa TaxID=1583 RepID=UPI0022E2C1E3|nr:hypothetical protein [Weissella confusa]